MPIDQIEKKNRRPKIDIDLQLLGVLAEAGCSADQISGMLKRSGLPISMRTIKRRLTEPDYRSAWEEGVAVGQAKLRMTMVEQSKLMNSAGVSMSIHLSRQWLGMTEKSALELSGRIDSQVEVSSAGERLNRKLDAIAERLTGRVAGIAAAAGASLAPASVE